MWPSNGSGSYNHNHQNCEIPSYDSSNHHPQPTQMQGRGMGYGMGMGMGSWGQPGQDRVVTSPAMHKGAGNSSHGFNSPGCPNYYNDHRAVRNSFPNQGSGHEGQGSRHPHNSSPKVLPSPVFRNEPPSPQPNAWPIQESGSFNNFYGNGFHPRAQGPRTPTEGFQPMQFTPPNQRPNFSGPRGRGSFPQNHRRGRGAPWGGGGGRGGHARGGTDIGSNSGRGRGRGGNKMPLPAKSKGKSQASFTFTHVCDPCERWFNSEEQLTNHIAEHRTCGIDGCKLTAHPGVVEKHIKMQHDTGLFMKMKDMVNSDDFAKWRAERKMRYPSKENIAKRQEEQEEKIKRGESIGNDKGRFPERKRGPNYKRHVRQREAEKRRFSETVDRMCAEAAPPVNSGSKKFLFANNEDKSSSSAINTKMPFSHSVDEEQILDNLIKEERAFSDTEWEPVVPETGEGKSAADVPKLSAALNTLASMYDSDSGEECEINKSTSIKLEHGVGRLISEDNDVGADLPTEEPIGRVALVKEDNTDCERPRNISNKRNNQRQQRMEMSKQRKMNHGDRNASGFKRKPDVSLLQKLLASEIRHERNVVLQCIRYIVENNFLTVAKLEKVQNTDSTPSSCGPETTPHDVEMDLPCLNNEVANMAVTKNKSMDEAQETTLMPSTAGGTDAALSTTSVGTSVSVPT